MSSHQLAAAAAAAAAAGGARPSATQPPPPFNLLLTSAVLGGVLAAVCAACYCCGRASRARKPTGNSSVYTLSADCPHSRALYPETANDGYLPFRRPPTPGPPPAYDSVVSSTDKLRRFGIECDEDTLKFDRYILHEGSTGPEELRDTVADTLDDLSFCTIRRGCMDRFEPTIAGGSSQHVSDNSERSYRETPSYADNIVSTRAGILKTSLPKDGEEPEDASLPTYEVAISIAETSRGHPM